MSTFISANDDDDDDDTRFTVIFRNNPDNPVSLYQNVSILDVIGDNWS